jgi:phosphoribosylpyrophosphate synthetase
MKIICTRSAQHIGTQLRKDYNLNVLENCKNNDGKNRKIWFPDGQPVIGVKNEETLDGEDVVFISSGQPNIAINIFELEELIKTAEENNAANVRIVFSYFPFSMQDATNKDKDSFRPGERNVARDILDKFSAYEMFAVHPHFGNKPWINEYDFTDISTQKYLLDNISTHMGVDMENIVLVSADAGESERSGNPGFFKKRINSTKVNVKANSELAELIKGKFVGLGDDLIKSGRTMIKCRDAALKCNIKGIFAYATHGLMNSGVKRVRNEFNNQLYLLDTIARRNATFSCAPLIYNAIK